MKLGSASAFLLGASILALGLQACSDDDKTPATPAPVADAGPTADAKPEAGPPLGTPIEAEAGKWTWVPFDDSSCANGSPTGIGINKGTSKRLVIFLEGGGACWSKGTCASNQLVANIPDGYGEEKFTKTVEAFPGGLFDRTVAENPYKDASFVYVPYCTGDVHSGDKEQDYEGTIIKHYGRRNMSAFLQRLVPTFKDVERVTLSGSSAGGFGSALNYARVANAFAPTRVDLVDDSGPPFPLDKMPNLATWSASWDLGGGVEPDCTGCDTDVSKIIPYYKTRYPDARFALLSYDTDQTIRLFLTFPDPPMAGEDFKATIEAVMAKDFDSDNARHFELKGNLHTVLRRMVKTDAVVTENNVTLAKWLGDMTNDAAWTSVKPAPAE